MLSLWNMKVRRQWRTASTGSWDTIIIIWFIWEWKKPQQAREPLPPNNWCKPQQSLTWRAPVAFHQSLFSHDSQKTPLRTIVMSGYFSAQNPLAVPNSPSDLWPLPLSREWTLPLVCLAVWICPASGLCLAIVYYRGLSGLLYLY